jgi:hypothetical protein
MSEATVFERGVGVVVLSMAGFALVFLWCCAARAMFVERYQHELNLGLLAVFFAPFFYGLCWVVGWLVS